jgi:hypothetical protein
MGSRLFDSGDWQTAGNAAPSPFAWAPTEKRSPACACSDLVEAERQIMLVERKIQLEREMQVRRALACHWSTRSRSWPGAFPVRT